jgi:hypothetical protein
MTRSARSTQGKKREDWRKYRQTYTHTADIPQEGIKLRDRMHVLVRI